MLHASARWIPMSIRLQKMTTTTSFVRGTASTILYRAGLRIQGTIRLRAFHPLLRRHLTRSVPPSSRTKRQSCLLRAIWQTGEILRPCLRHMLQAPCPSKYEVEWTCTIRCDRRSFNTKNGASGNARIAVPRQYFRRSGKHMRMLQFAMLLRLRGASCTAPCPGQRSCVDLRSRRELDSRSKNGARDWLHNSALNFTRNLTGHQHLYRELVVGARLVSGSAAQMWMQVNAHPCNASAKPCVSGSLSPSTPAGPSLHFVSEKCPSHPRPREISVAPRLRTSSYTLQTHDDR